MSVLETRSFNAVDLMSFGTAAAVALSHLYYVRVSPVPAKSGYPTYAPPVLVCSLARRFSLTGAMAIGGGSSHIPTGIL
jgi:hypothetical protein